MACYCYDGTFEGFICALSRALDAGDSSSDFSMGASTNDGGLFQELEVVVTTDRKEALAFRTQFVTQVSPEAFAAMRYAFHSGQPGIERRLWSYAKKGFNEGSRFAFLVADKLVNEVDRLARAVSREAHKYKGFVRFRELRQGFLYARIEPEYDVTIFLAPHFKSRVPDRPWMIHDVRRSVAALYDLNDWRLVTGIRLEAAPDYSGAEQQFTALWQRYFQRLAIRERHNPRLQRQHVPLRSRKYLVEFEEPE